MTTTESHTAFEQAYAAIESAQAGYAQHVNTHKDDVATMRTGHADPRGHITDQDAARIDIAHSDRLRAYAETDRARAIDTAVETMRERRDIAEANVTKIRASLSPEGDTAAELRATRFWDRTKDVLDSLKDASGGLDPDRVRTRTEQILKEAKPADLGTLLQEIDAFFEARRIPSAGWLEQTLNDLVPDYVSAKRTLQRATQALTITEGNANMVRTAIASGHPAPTNLVRPSGQYDPDKG